MRSDINILSNINPKTASFINYFKRVAVIIAFVVILYRKNTFYTIRGGTNV